VSDWADEKAREWLLTAELSPEGRIPVGLALGETRERNLAALLREVAHPTHVSVFAERLAGEQALLRYKAEVRSVVEGVRSYHWYEVSGVDAAKDACDSILHRLEKL
jgi:hypothetical protein